MKNLSFFLIIIYIVSFPHLGCRDSSKLPVEPNNSTNVSTSTIISGTTHNESFANRRNKVVLVLFDISRSISKDEKEKYYGYFEKNVMRHLKINDILFVGRITNNSLNEPLLNITLEPMKSVDIQNDNNNEFYRKRAEAKARKKHREQLREKILTIKKQVNNWLSGETDATDILGAIRIVNQAFDFNDADNYNKWMIIMSDMMHASNNYNFNNLKLTDQIIQNIISLEGESQGGLPDMHFINVYVCGAFTISSITTHELHNFWEEYFTACGAHLIKFSRTPLNWDFKE